MAMTSEISIIRESRLTRLATAIARWSRRRGVRADLAEIYLGDEHAERRAQLEEQLLLDREIRAFQSQLDQAKNLSTLYRAF